MSPNNYNFQKPPHRSLTSPVQRGRARRWPDHVVVYYYKWSLHYHLLPSRYMHYHNCFNESHRMILDQPTRASYSDYSARPIIISLLQHASPSFIAPPSTFCSSTISSNKNNNKSDGRNQDRLCFLVIAKCCGNVTKEKWRAIVTPVVVLVVGRWTRKTGSLICNRADWMSLPIIVPRYDQRHNLIITEGGSFYLSLIMITRFDLIWWWVDLLKK